MKEPNFFIIGAPKCGTSSLAQWLGQHQSVYISPKKEPHYFSTDLSNRNIQSWKRYQKLFSDAGKEHLAVGEASTWYLYSKEAVPSIEGSYTNAKYIVMTRDPVDMARSLHHHNLRVLHENCSSLEDAWALQGERASGKQIPSTCAEPAFLQYKTACSLGTLLNRLYAFVDSERVLHIALEDMKTDPEYEYQRVQAFLGISDEGRTEFPVVNEARGHRSRLVQKLLRTGSSARNTLGINRGLGLARFNENDQPKARLSKRFQEKLVEEFLEERYLLDQLYHSNRYGKFD